MITRKEKTMNRELRVLTLEKMKAQIRDVQDEELELLHTWGMACESVIIDMTNRTFEELEAWEDAHGKGFPEALESAMLLLVAHLFRNREPVSSVTQNMVPFTISMLVKPYVKLSNRSES
ncbi:MAG TPA: hypothetical protein DDY95_05385 [Bacteroides sp.]|jgi:hypothetical protein|nr:head-tail connector protein [Phocaeicola vulgatus]DAH19102.1 MAG TPA: head tail connector [Caudoviricetes sp.]HBJ20548.1 hypothetical protein [Bacteroides sp.]RGT47474.1 phage gp6-like head-tail connector protein [Phocaeicola vulgatus]RHA10333.1 phage gp6-like head-tail connector protein [Phocaeicola vulgatus]RHC70442.1 phage gp6-like head-tail connector protein [Phocaeicola vulgatus]